MAIKNTNSGGVDFVSSESVYGEDLNDTFGGVILPIPIGGVVPWAKSIPNVPALSSNFLECDGTTVNDADSVLNGETIPDLNGEKRFLQGSAASGLTGGTSANTLTHTLTSIGGVDDETLNSSQTRSDHVFSNVPKYYSIVYIIRIK